MIKHFTSLCLIFLISYNVYAQFGYGDPDDIRALKKRTLLVELKEPDKKTVKKYRKRNQEKLDTYLDNIDNYNESIKLAFTENWGLSKNVKFVSFEEIEEISDDKNRKDQFGYFKTYKRNRSMAGNLDESFYEIGLTNLKKPIYSFQSEPFSDFKKADAIVVVQQIRNYLNMRIKKDKENLRRRDLRQMIEERTKKLKNKMLYINEDLVSSRFKRKMSSVYSYDYKIVSKSKIDKAIVDKTENIAYVRSIPIAQTSHPDIKYSGERIYVQIFINAETGKILANAGRSIGARELTVRDMKNIVKDIED